MTLVAGGVALSSVRFEARPVRADAPPPALDLWTMGRNRVGQLGAVAPNPTIPWPMHEARHWVAISAGSEHTLALTDTGEVYAWGNNVNGQLGDGTTTDSMLPVQVQGLTGVTLIAAGGSHSLAYRASDATLWAWGDNSLGALAQPESVAKSDIPLVVANTGSLTAIAAGGSHSMALAQDGTVYAWGNNERGQLGLGDVAIRRTPTAVPLTAKATAIGAGNEHSLAVTVGDGQVWTWGWNVFGGLGNGEQGQPTQAYPNPGRAIGVVGIAEVSGGDFHSLARTTDGHVWAWGYNTEGQVGNGADTPANTGVLTPVLLSGIDQVSHIDAGGIHSIALRNNGEVWSWGSNEVGACGTNAHGFQKLPAKTFGDLAGVAVSAGSVHSVVLAAPRAVAKVIELGDSSSSQAPLTLPLVHERTGPSDIADLAAGWNHVLLLDGQHRVWSWGDDSAGQLGTPDGTHADPELVDIPLDGAAGFVKVAARANQSFALRSDGVVFAWGDNRYGALGLGSVELQDHPATIAGLGHAVSVAAGERHGIALTEDGSVWAWGQNLAGQLGTRPSSALVTTPAEVPAFYGSTFIAAGGFHNASIDIVGNVQTWGDGFHAQLGTGGIVSSYAPVPAVFGNYVTTIALGRFHSLAVLSGGKVSSFGDGSACQLGEGVIDGAWSPMQPRVPATAALVTAGEYDSLVVGTDGKAYGWGDDSRGALGAPGPSYSHLACHPVVAQTGAVVLAAGGGAFTVVAVTD